MNQYPKRGRPSPQILKAFCEFFHYDPDTGELFWTKNRGTVKAGRRAGWKNGGKGGGYILVEFFGIEYKAHHIIWYLLTGHWPDDEVDHKNYDRADNRKANLREATHAENSRNQKRKKLPKSGYPGVYPQHRSKTWWSRIMYKGETIYLGSFRTKERASEVYEETRKLLFREFAPA